ncbi:hypothetical protein OH76DRAFT_1301486, partial [Lentinus brumalis]
LIQLELGVTSWDALSDALFRLRAFLIVVFGDIPAVSLLMRMKGHNAVFPCRMCKIQGIRNDTTKTLYVPLDRRNFAHDDDIYDAFSLPLRSHEEFLASAAEVDNARNDAEADRLSKKSGIKGTALLSSLSSLSFPTSFPFGFMHQIWENLIPNLVDLWTDNFKELDLSDAPFRIPPDAWEAIGADCSASGNTIPSAFGRRVPNIATTRTEFTAEAWCLFALHIAPALLRKRFRDKRYYVHFIELIQLLELCLQFEISTDDIGRIRTGFAKWVQDYERYV